MVFDATRDAFAAIVGLDTTTAGIVLGFIIVIVLLIALAWALGEAIQGFGLVVVGGAPVVLVILIGYWPIWTGVFIGLLLLFSIINPFGQGSGM